MTLHSLSHTFSALEDWRSKPILRFALWDKDFGSGDDALYV